MHEWQIYTFDHTGNNDRIHSNLTRLSSKQVITRIFLRSIAVAGTVVLLGAAMASAAPATLDGVQMPAMPASAKVDPDLSLHLTPPKSGTYALWIQFVGGAEVRTVPFVLSVR